MRSAPRRWWVALTLACVVTPALPAEATSPQAGAEMIRLIDALEKSPNGPDAPEQRRKVLQWLTDAPDVTVELCGDYLGIEKFKPGDKAGDLVLQQAFSEARYILENPDAPQDGQAVHLAGVEAVLRTYAAMQADDPKLVIAPLEKLSRLQADQKLSEHVTKAMAKCN